MISPVEGVDGNTRIRQGRAYIPDEELLSTVRRFAEWLGAARVWCVGFSDAKFARSIVQADLIARQYAREITAYHTIWYCFALPATDMHRLLIPLGDPNHHSWSLHFFEGQTTPTEQMLERFIGLCEPHSGDDAIYSPDWVPHFGAMKACLSSAIGMARLEGFEVKDLMLASSKHSAESIQAWYAKERRGDVLLLDEGWESLFDLEDLSTRGIEESQFRRLADG